MKDKTNKTMCNFLPGFLKCNEGSFADTPSLKKKGLQVDINESNVNSQSITDNIMISHTINHNSS